MNSEDSVGGRIARIRKLRGMTQTQLAQEAGVSKSMVAKVERSHEAASTAFIGAVSRALGVDAARITGGMDEEPESLHQLVPTVRRALATVDLLPDDLEPESLDQLYAEVVRLGEYRRATKYQRIGKELPSLVDRLLVTAREEGEPAYALLTGAYRAANTLAHKLGYSDLSLTAMERMEWAADRSGDPLLVATTHYLHAAALARIGAAPQAMRLLARTIDEIEPMVGGDDVAAEAVYQALHMRAGVIAATMADAESSDAHLAEAGIWAARTGERVVHETVVGPTNVQLHKLAAAVDLGQSRKAVKLSEATHLPDDFAKERATYFWLDTARAHLANADPDSAVTALYEARALSPEHFRASRTVRATIKTVAAQQRRSSDNVRSLANSAGLDD
jgi:transcriptional regulator with XRE-family HTH domain